MCRAEEFARVSSARVARVSSVKVARVSSVSVTRVSSGREFARVSSVRVTRVPGTSRRVCSCVVRNGCSWVERVSFLCV